MRDFSRRRRQRRWQIEQGDRNRNAFIAMFVFIGLKKFPTRWKHKISNFFTHKSKKLKRKANKFKYLWWIYSKSVTINWLSYFISSSRCCFESKRKIIHRSNELNAFVFDNLHSFSSLSCRSRSLNNLSSQ